MADFPPVDPSAVRPTVDDVAQLERTRTVDENTGEDIGQFTGATRPTASDVETLIDMATDDELTRLPAEIDPELYPAVSRLIAMRTAILVEVSFFRVQVENGPVQSLAKMLADDQAALDLAVRDLPLRLD